eukprot:TRINITY_DN144521_c0_g1_i1.p3 TRINITY_DN144521_c0_g1~~TRINITY_DN144521_c0_g1_i1.p3  ORF type:complete len:102 (-),score=6.76 TRINITY_DN144521_c0_g1_i1:50-355(-)
MIDPINCYLMTLRVIQPARIQDVEKSANIMFPNMSLPESGDGSLRAAHKYAQEKGLVVQVRRGSYHLSRAGGHLVSLLGVDSELDNRRLFLIKSQRKALTQ